MKTRSIITLLLAGQCLWCRAAEEISFQPVALAEQPAPGTTNVLFGTFQDVSLADNGQVAFTANIFGLGISSTNDLGLWAGSPGDLMLLVRTGDPVPGATNGEVFSSLAAPNIDNHQAVGFLADPDERYEDWLADLPPKVGEIIDILLKTGEQAPIPRSPWKSSQLLGHVLDEDASRATFSGPGIGLSNNTAIVAGPPTNIVIVGREGFPAPGTSTNDASTNFITFPELPEDLAVAPDGRVVFSDAAGGSSLNVGYGIWFGNASNLQAVAVYGKPAPDSLLGPGYTFGDAGDAVSVNDRDEVAFVAGLQDTNSNYANCLCAGAPDALRVVAQSGQPAPGISNAVFEYFGEFAMASDGTVAFEAAYTGSSNAFGLWLAPTDGPPILIARNGAHAPGTPAGVVFANTSFTSVTAPFTDVYLNRQDQIAFRAELSGPGVGWPTNNIGIWLAEPNGNVTLVARNGDSFEVAPGVERQLADLTLGADTVGVAGPDDGRPCPFNDRGEILFETDWSNPSGSTFHSITGLFLARPGILLNAERSGKNILLQFPTLAGKHYEVDDKTNLSAPSWSVLDSSVSGTGGEVSVTNAPTSSATVFYHVVRTD